MSFGSDIRPKPLTKPEGATLRWRPPVHSRFVQHMSTVILNAPEIATITLNLPWIFIENKGIWRAIALLGKKGHSPWLTTEGQWKQPPAPFLLRVYPFTVLPVKGTFQMGYWNDPDCIGETGALVFENDELSPKLASIAEMFSHFISGVSAVQTIGEMLYEAGALRASKIGYDGQGNLYEVDETALRKVGGATLEKLHKTGALGAAHAQLLSRHHLAKLNETGKVKANSAMGSSFVGDGAFLDAVAQDLETGNEFELGPLSE